MPRLFDFYAPLFSFGLALQAQAAAAREPAQASRLAREQLMRARSQALDAGHALAQVESATFAVVAWLDEVLAQWPQGAADSLQLMLFNSTTAGTEFFHHLSALGPHDAQVREVYWYALAQGFHGQYHFERGQDAGMLARLKALHAAQLPLAPIRPSAWGAWASVPSVPGVAVPPARHARPWRFAVLAAAMAFVALACAALMPCVDG
ncbi:DotU family type IV/VI secretion system protein [uncultured Pseudacidovorax sp.]|uniref:DotU family type IV/VI secretion system protein n=1 Tax=uncultured Pseudacidovorax sp. TaxID=679313 RepID=UPI0025D09934|nr:DotU family type IV/VI secretion system protein [uncultured Pseudacidovorax sp.]